MNNHFGVWAAVRELSAREADRAAKCDLERENRRLRREIETTRAELAELRERFGGFVGSTPPQHSSFKGRPAESLRTG
jgi:hypothetical protein